MFSNELYGLSRKKDKCADLTAVISSEDALHRHDTKIKVLN